MGDIYDRRVLNGNSEVAMTELPLDGTQVHITQFDRATNERYSWNTDSNTDGRRDGHYTDQNVPKSHPGRH